MRLYETISPDGKFSRAIAERVGRALERLEASRVPIVDNGPVPGTA
ncbi:hypothetical protein [Devosia nitrariae]|nr:hypothetical protein [Devosia nitrariae]